MSNSWRTHEPESRVDEPLEPSQVNTPEVTSPNLKELLLAPEPRAEALTPPRRKLPGRAAPTFD